MMIRPAIHSDAEKLIGMGRRFFEASGYEDITTFRPEVFAATLDHVFTNGVLLVADDNGPVGMAAALVYPFYFSGDMTAQELLWWVDEEHRGIGGHLLDGLIAAVKAKGAQSLSMISLDKLNPEKVGKMYEKRGFRRSEHSYIKKL